MAIKIKTVVRENIITKNKVASATIVDLQTMEFDEYCDYLAQDSTVGAADVAAVMTQIVKKLPLLLAMGVKVKISADGMIVRPTVRGSLTQEKLRARLEQRKADGDTSIDTDREILASDLAIADLVAGVAVEFSKRFKSIFSKSVTFKCMVADERKTKK